MTEPRIAQYLAAAKAMAQGQFGAMEDSEAQDEVGRLGEAIQQLGRSLRDRWEETQRLLQITERINAGVLLDEVMDKIYRSFRTVFPYDRMSLALLDKDGEVLTARWTRTEAKTIRLGVGYASPVVTSSLQTVIALGQPRILNDLEAYLAEHPSSDSTRLIVEEGMRSSLTCPLISRGRTVGVLFFTSMAVDTYRELHLEVFRQIAGQVAVIVEKGYLHQELQELSDTKNRFLGMVAHDLRYPLSLSSAYLDLFLDGSMGDLAPDQLALLRIIAGHQERLLEQVNKVLDMSTIAAGHLDLNLELVDSHSLLSELLEAFEVAARSRSLDLRVVHAKGIPPVRMDLYRIRQVLANLMANTIQTSQPGSAIVLSTSRDGRFLKIRITHHGRDISPHEVPSLFTHHDADRPGPKSSSGMGFAIAQGIVEAHGGSIRAENQGGAGTTLTVALPLDGS